MQNRSKILDAIAKPHDIQTLSTQELEQLSEDCRQRIIEVTSQQGGHLASSLGAVEIAVALFKVFDFRRDRVVWDVGHQAYAHKLLSGRNERFETLAQYGGIKKFLSRDESSYDHFGAGHASTSISAALGMAFSRDLQQQAHYVIAVIGDGAMTGGLAFEALNHNGFANKNMILIVNDNGMSIDPNVGALSKMITRVISSPSYNWLRDETREWASRVPFSEPLQHALQKINTSLKTFLLPGMLFEQLGWRYFGPIDGHSVGDLVELLSHVKDLDGPIVIHALTQKGKGYSFAEEDAFTYHGVSPFEPATGNFVKKSSSGIQQKSYSKVFAEKLEDLMEADSQVVALSAAMMSGTGIIGLHEKYPERVLDVGIAEGHAVTCAAGLAAEGSKPFVAIYSTFLQRALDHIIHDVAIQKLPVRFALDRAGLVGVDGPTHHGCFDLTY
ncbi:MAG: 1-deoxy-D-xylulose-5-phosphate synthase, partial [Proteobacteria bacterium]|nr:1-deoxy-D-xylulose-5-phosphate synthase [Pseudomonadota bacterium]